MAISTLYILSNANVLIIKDFGLVSMISISMGCIIKNFSNFYIISNSISNCFLQFLLLSIGFLLIYTPFTIKLIIASTFTIKFNSGRVDYILLNNILSTQICENLFFSNKNKLSSVIKNNFKGFASNENCCHKDIISNKKIGNKNNNRSSTDNLPSRVESNVSYENIYGSQIMSNANGSQSHLSTLQYNNLNHNSNCNLNLNQHNSNNNVNQDKIKNKFEKMLRLCYYNIITTYISFILYLIPSIVYYIIARNKSLSSELMINNYFHHICPSNYIMFLMTIVQFIFLIYDILKYQLISNGRYIFVDCKIIGILCIIWIFFEPILNITLYTLFKNNLGTSQIIQFYSNFKNIHNSNN
ncbi:hypothetical protein BCR36DRAFT_402658 [Piromyces finnis]|uniref:Uncharacterized protein n=1 Tax=Piromyces finnis TaxID=1754191 RepID=A0A1Y1VI47_9FUNG|nr:hypothetical protein BCR36DRAFT_402658 [Piromyces finnis]|eukprot:ORX56690.1 hypothetical protein BCR36DRAFT_402658 [Piromyces finnis]